MSPQLTAVWGRTAALGKPTVVCGAAGLAAAAVAAWAWRRWHPGTKLTPRDADANKPVSGMGMPDINSKELVLAAVNPNLNVTVAVYNPTQPSNFGAILRTCACLGVPNLICISTQKKKWEPPWLRIDHAIREFENASQTKRGTQGFVNVQYLTVDEFVDFTEEHKAQGSGGLVVALETANDADLLHRFQFGPGGPMPDDPAAAGGTRRILLLFGGESTGLSNRRVLHTADSLVVVPMMGHSSLNLAATVAITVWEVTRQGLMERGC